MNVWLQLYGFNEPAHRLQGRSEIKKERQTYILWVHEGRIIEGVRRIIHVNRES